MNINFIVGICCIVGTIYYVTLDSPKQPRIQGCYGECYEKYVEVHGSFIEELQAQVEAAEADEFSSIRGLWAGCAACHGQSGEGMGAFPKLAGQTSDYISDRLYAYKNREQIGAMSSTMWAQAGMLSAEQMDLIGEFIQEGMPGE